MTKKRKALQVSALLSAVSGATMIVAAGSASAAETNRVEERCWDQERTAPTTQYRMHGCAYDQYGLTPKGDGGDNTFTPTDPGTGGGGGGGPSGGGGYTPGA
jgi:hypothetical protein